MSDDPDDAALAAAFVIEQLLDTCRDGRFYEDHDESMAMLTDAYEALDTLTHAATAVESGVYHTGGYVPATSTGTTSVTVAWHESVHNRFRRLS